MKISCIIVDDEFPARKLLAGYAEKLVYLEVKAVCKNALEAMHALQEHSPDLMFLDIQMPELTGIELLTAIKNKPAVIFTTAYREYALKGYELDVVDYMLKPVSFERFLQGVNKAAEMIRLKKLQEEAPRPVEFFPEKKEPEYINIKADYKIYKVKLAEILYIEGLKEYVTFYTTERKFIVLESLRNLENKLPANRFRRVHKSYIVNLGRITALYGNTIEIGKTEIPIGKSYADTVKKDLFSL